MGTTKGTKGTKGIRTTNNSKYLLFCVFRVFCGSFLRTFTHHAYIRSHTQLSCGRTRLRLAVGIAPTRAKLANNKRWRITQNHHTSHHTSSAHLSVLCALCVPSLRTFSHHTYSSWHIKMIASRKSKKAWTEAHAFYFLSFILKF